MRTRFYKVITSKHSNIAPGMIGKGKYNSKLKGYEITFKDLTTPTPFNQTTQDTTLFFEKHEVKRHNTN